MIADITPQNSVFKSTPSRSLNKLKLQKQQTEQEEGRRNSQPNNQISSSINFQEHFSARSASSSISGGNSMLTTNMSQPPFDTNMLLLGQQQDASYVQSANMAIANFSQTETKFSTSASSHTSAEIIPRELLPEKTKKEIRLENPTKYHVLQIEKTLKSEMRGPAMKNDRMSLGLTYEEVVEENMRKHMKKMHVKAKTSPLKPSNSSFNKNLDVNELNLDDIELGHEALSLPSSDIAVIANGSALSDFHLNEIMNSGSHSSLVDPSFLSSPSNSSFSTADLTGDDLDPDELDVILRSSALGANLSDIDLRNIQDMELFLKSPQTMPNDAEYINGMSSKPTATTSSSCPVNNSAIKPPKTLNSLTTEQLNMLIKERIKKDNHNMSKFIL